MSNIIELMYMAKMKEFGKKEVINMQKTVPIFSEAYIITFLFYRWQMCFLYSHLIKVSVLISLTDYYSAFNSSVETFIINGALSQYI